MKIRPQFTDVEIFYQDPIKLPGLELTSNVFSEITFPHSEIKPIEIFTLPSFYQSTLEEKKTAIKLFFDNYNLKFDNIKNDAPLFNTADTHRVFNGEILFDIECILFPFINYSMPENFIIHTNTFELNNISNAKCVKIKIRPEIEALKILATTLNERAKEGGLPLLRFDGNRKFELDDLILFLNLLDDSVIKAIDYIEEPFKNFYDNYSFQRINNIKIAIDESLVSFLNNLEKIPKNSPIILKPALYGISQSFDLIKKASLLGHPVIISSTYQPVSAFVPLMALAHYSDTFNITSLFHGLDTLKFLPVTYQNSQVLNSLSIS